MIEYEILPGGDMRIYVDEAGREWLRQEREERGDAFGTDGAMYELLAPLTEGDLVWVDPADIGALTSAPILGYLADDGETIDRAWGFMDYALDSLQDRLLDKGEAILQTGS